METFSFIALILLSLVAYSAGAVSRARQLVDLKPRIIDLIVVLIIWGGAVYSRITFDSNKWLLILIWVTVSFLVGILVSIPSKSHEIEISRREKSEGTSKNLIKNLWHRWKIFSKRIGSFQSKIILSWFFFIFVTPFALAVKVFSDPLRIKPQRKKSHWILKKEIKSDLDQFRRQF